MIGRPVAEPRALRAEAAALFTEAQLVEIVLLAGFYNLVSFVVNATSVERETGTPGFPQAN